MGKGATARVYRSQTRDEPTETALALKIFSRSPSNVKALAKLEDEAHCMSRVVHPSVVRLHTFSMAAQIHRQGIDSRPSLAPVLAMELASNGELFPFLSAPFSIAASRSIFRQLLDALHACHSAGICHRDVSLMNILVTHSFNLKLGDFGHAAEIPTGPSPPLLQGSCGTGVYAPPEVVAGRPHNGIKVDVWAAGVVLFIALTGHPPWSVAAPQDWFFAAFTQGREGDFWKAHSRSSPNIPTEVVDLLTDILTDSNRRPTVSWLQSHPWLCGSEGEYVDRLKEEDKAELVAELKFRSRVMGKTRAGGVPGNRGCDVDGLRLNGVIQR
ncbi:unnamed protein product [Discosporangium mesarthrocarpum]